MQLSLFMWKYDHGELPTCFNDYFKKVNSIHTHNTRSSSSKKLSVNFLVSTDTYGKNMLQFIGPRIFNEIVSLDFYNRCNNKIGFKSCMKKHLLSGQIFFLFASKYLFAIFILFLFSRFFTYFLFLIGNIFRVIIPSQVSIVCPVFVCVVAVFCFFSVVFFMLTQLLFSH